MVGYSIANSVQVQGFTSGAGCSQPLLCACISHPNSWFKLAYLYHYFVFSARAEANVLTLYSLVNHWSNVQLSVGWVLPRVLQWSVTRQKLKCHPKVAF